MTKKELHPFVGLPGPSESNRIGSVASKNPANPPQHTHSFENLALCQRIYPGLLAVYQRLRRKLCESGTLFETNGSKAIQKHGTHWYWPQLDSLNMSFIPSFYGCRRWMCPRHHRITAFLFSLTFGATSIFSQCINNHSWNICGCLDPSMTL
jgi:hypothetical protein